jgi:hypothetical protein
VKVTHNNGLDRHCQTPSPNTDTLQVPPYVTSSTMQAKHYYPHQAFTDSSSHTLACSTCPTTPATSHLCLRTELFDQLRPVLAVLAPPTPRHLP